MADAASKGSIYNHNTRQRIETTEINELSTQPVAWDDERSWGLMCDIDAVISGLTVSHSADNTFNIGAGACLYQGQLLKDTASPQSQVVLDDNTDLSDPRIDVVYVDGPDLVVAASSKTLLSNYIRTDEAAEAVGTGDGSTKAFDLGYSGVDIRTLKVQVAAAAAGGWNLSPGTGTAGVDQIIFGTAPASGAITADYTREEGGEESNSSVTTSYEKIPSYAIEKGTPAMGVPTLSSPGMVLAHISVPAGWTGGASGVTIVNGFTTSGDEVKPFMIDVDADNDADGDGFAPGERPNAGKLYSAIRGMSQVVHGCRLQWVASNQFTVTPGWGVMYGISFRNRAPTTITVTGSDVASAGWHYVYGRVIEPGEPLTIAVSTTPPDSLRRDSSFALMGGMYLGAIYATASATIRPFYTHDNYTYWEAPTAIPIETSVGTHPLIVTDWVPFAGRLFNAHVEVDFTGDGAARGFAIQLQSHLAATSKPWPKFIADADTVTDAVLVNAFGNGWLRAEKTGSALEAHYVTTITSPIGDSTYSGNVYVLGYLDDYRTMTEAGAVPSATAPGY